MRSRGPCSGAGALVLFLASLAHADVIELTTGQRLNGRVEALTPTAVVFQRHGGTVSVERSRVRAIYLDASPAPAAPPRLPVHDVLDALKRLAEINNNLDVYRERASRLSVTMAAVQRYMESPDRGDPELQEAVGAALRYLTLAIAALDPALTARDLVAIGRDEALDRCPHLRETLQRDVPRFRSADEMRNRGVAVSMFGVGALWTCGVEKIAEAERLLAGEN